MREETTGHKRPRLTSWGHVQGKRFSLLLVLLHEHGLQSLYHPSISLTCYFSVVIREVCKAQLTTRLQSLKPMYGSYRGTLCCCIWWRYWISLYLAGQPSTRYSSTGDPPWTGPPRPQCGSRNNESTQCRAARQCVAQALHRWCQELFLSTESSRGDFFMSLPSFLLSWLAV